MSALTGPAAAPQGPVRAFLRLVMIEHSVFALPFAYVAALTAMAPDVRWGDLALVTVAMVAARTFAMGANRIIDREIDARNPRTASRELVTGAVSLRTAVAGALVALALFLAAAAALNPLAFALAPLAVVPLVAYPYAKRVTWAPHAVLALSQAVAPIGAWIAVTGRWSWTAVVLGLAVGIWIGGFDIIYALQDYEVDRVIGVRSLPVRFGPVVALRVARVAHALTVALLVWFGALTGAGAWWYAGVAASAAALAYEQSLVRPDDLRKVNRAFFTVNGFVGIGLFAFALADLIARGLHA
ncbi:MAG TPA: menaquinone biosynthesis prenyltransferase MqnP [Mycobacteriales bacterium]|nr:menaquinone biosynthesis prenyltransferase MqnP [Mycobacteriales bacterium]